MEGLVFGKYFTDHMLTVRWEAGQGWGTPVIRPFAPLSMHPASKVLHYGQEIFEGMKAFKGDDGKIRMFRPNINMDRMNYRQVRKEPAYPP